MKVSLTGIRQERSSRFVQQAFRSQGQRGANRLTAVLAPFAQEGEVVPDLWLLMQLLLRKLIAVTEEMISSDVAHQNELAGDKHFRNLRDELTSTLIAKMIKLRNVCRETYGPTRIEEVGFSEETPRDPLTIMRVGRSLLNLLAGPGFSFPDPDPDFAANAMAPQQVIAAFGSIVDDLDEVLHKVNEHIKNAQSSLVVKNQKSEFYKNDVFWIARWLQATFALAGMTEEADKIKPVIRRRGRIEEIPDDLDVEPDEGETDEDEPDEGEADESEETETEA